MNDLDFYLLNDLDSATGETAYTLYTSHGTRTELAREPGRADAYHAHTQCVALLGGKRSARVEAEWYGHTVAVVRSDSRLTTAGHVLDTVLDRTGDAKERNAAWAIYYAAVASVRAEFAMTDDALATARAALDAAIDASNSAWVATYATTQAAYLRDHIARTATIEAAHQAMVERALTEALAAVHDALTAAIDAAYRAHTIAYTAAAHDAARTATGIVRAAAIAAAYAEYDAACEAAHIAYERSGGEP